MMTFVVLEPQYSNIRHSYPRQAGYVTTSGPFYQHDLTLIPAWISNYTHFNVWGEISYPFLNFNGCTVEV